MDSVSAIENVLDRFREQSKTYKDIFRDGQDTKNRNFKFVRNLKIDVKKSTSKEYTVTLTVSVDEQTCITAQKDGGGTIGSTEEFYKAFVKFFNGTEQSDGGKVLQFKL